MVVDDDGLVLLMRIRTPTGTDEWRLPQVPVDREADAAGALQYRLAVDLRAHLTLVREIGRVRHDTETEEISYAFRHAGSGRAPHVAKLAWIGAEEAPDLLVVLHERTWLRDALRLFDET